MLNYQRVYSHYHLLGWLLYPMVSPLVAWWPQASPVLEKSRYGRRLVRWKELHCCGRSQLRIAPGWAGCFELLELTKNMGFSMGFGYGSIPINTIFSGMNIHLPAILMSTRGIGFWHTAIWQTQTVGFEIIYIYLWDFGWGLMKGIWWNCDQTKSSLTWLDAKNDHWLRPCLTNQEWGFHRQSMGNLQCSVGQWIGLRENLQETIDFPIKYGAFLQIFP